MTSISYGLEDKVAVVTGGSRGIGLDLAKMLLAQGAKVVVEMMTQTLAQELAPFNIQVNAVAPCMVRTGFSQPFWSNDDLLREIVKTIPMGRVAETVDVVHPVLFLCSDGAGFITGQPDHHEIQVPHWVCVVAAFPGRDVNGAFQVFDA